MAVLVDLDEEELHEPHPGHNDPLAYRIRQAKDESLDGSVEEEQADRANPNVNGFSAALACYPIVSQLASLLDLNTLHELSRTCRQFRANLLQYRSQLITLALRCTNESTTPGPRLADGLRSMRSAWNSNTIGPNGEKIGRITSGRVGPCARDMVGECRRCGTVVCRNCIMKAPPPQTLKGRHRRLCRTCIKSAFDKHTSFLVEDHDGEIESGADPEAFTYAAFARDPCTCPDEVWICSPCGQTLRMNDVTYMRGWTWRTRYSTYLGGLGTGIGEGNEGVECGRLSRCLAAREVEKEIDCDAEELAALRAETERAEMDGRTWGGTSYLMQEIEGIGGVVKKKVKKRVKVGAVVKEYEDERERGDYLSREHGGQNRSWCSWCERIVPGHKDLQGVDDGLDGLRLVSTNSSSSSL